MPTLDSTYCVKSSAQIYEQFEILQIMSYPKTLGRVHHPLLLRGKLGFVAGLVVTVRCLPAHPSAVLHPLTSRPAPHVEPCRRLVSFVWLKRCTTSYVSGNGCALVFRKFVLSAVWKEGEYIHCRLKQMLCLNSIWLCDWSFLMVPRFYLLFLFFGWFETVLWPYGS
jgi:hypothetical protein